MEAFVGQIELFAFNFAPRGWEPCKGQMLQISDYQTVFALLGIQFGGDGRSMFALPDLSGKEPVPNLHYYICLQGVFPPRN